MPSKYELVKNEKFDDCRMFVNSCQLISVVNIRLPIPLVARFTVIGTLAVNGWAVTFGTSKRGLCGLRPHPVPSSLYQM